MHILIGILTALGIVTFFVIRMGQVARASRELGEAASEVKGFVRKKRWQRKLNSDLVKQIDDPRLAATVMMCAVAQSDGEITERQKAAIVDAMTGDFEMSASEADDMLAHARWLSSEMKDLSSFLRSAEPPIMDKCTEGEKRDLLDMLATVAETEGPVTDIQRDAIARLRERLIQRS